MSSYLTLVLVLSQIMSWFSLAGCLSGVMHCRVTTAGAPANAGFCKHGGNVNGPRVACSLAEYAEKSGLFGAFFGVWRSAGAVYIEAGVICLTHDALTLRA